MKGIWDTKRQREFAAEFNLIKTKGLDNMTYDSPTYGEVTPNEVDSLRAKISLLERRRLDRV